MWRRVTATVRPLHPPLDAARLPTDAGHETAAANTPQKSSKSVAKPAAQHPNSAYSPVRAAPPIGSIGSATVDDGWERRLRSGQLVPDLVIDLHGHNLASAHGSLLRALDRAVAARARILLVVAGKVRGAQEAPRGAIRRELSTWLAQSAHAGRILAVRNAHPRHGGAGAVYLILRRAPVSACTR